MEGTSRTRPTPAKERTVPITKVGRFRIDHDPQLRTVELKTETADAEIRSVRDLLRRFLL
jgi:hypothetical protein